MIATATVVATFALDTLVGEPPERVHPVALFGRAVAPFDRGWSHPRAVGLAIALGLPLAVAAVLGGITAVAASFGPILAGTLATAVLFSTTSLRSLLAAATELVDATERDLDTARAAAPTLVGRDPADLSAADLRSAAVESAAENLADGLLAPLAAFTVGAAVSLPLAVAAATFVKAVNTLDSMLGYREKPVGRASARLDDLLMWLPARIAALLIAVAALAPGALRAASAWSRRPASPNAGWPMATMAAAVDARLAKPDAYVLNPDASPPSIDDARRSVRIVAFTGVLSFALAALATFALAHRTTLGLTRAPPFALAEVVAWS